MPFPAAPLDFIDHINPHLAQGWASVFGEYAWFRLLGFAEAVADLQRHAQQAGKSVSYDTIKQYRYAAIGTVPQALMAQLPNGGWNVISAPKIDDCGKSFPLRFDKACLAAATLDCCAQAVVPGVNILARMRVAPAIYRLRGFDDTLWAQIRSMAPIGGVAFVDALKAHTNQRELNFFNQIAKGQAATYRTLASIVGFLNTHNLGGGLVIEQMTTRDYRDPGAPRQRQTNWQRKHPSYLETVVAV
jgi:hypothetical protein